MFISDEFENSSVAINNQNICMLMAMNTSNRNEAFCLLDNKHCIDLNKSYMNKSIHCQLNNRVYSIQCNLFHPLFLLVRFLVRSRCSICFSCTNNQWIDNYIQLIHLYYNKLCIIYQNNYKRLLMNICQSHSGSKLELK